MIFNPTRDQARQFLFESWHKHNKGELLTQLEHMVAQQVIKHPEYQALLEDSEKNQNKEFHPAEGEINPFLHLMMHLTIEEQLSIDQPAGVRAQYSRLKLKYASEHEAQHQMMECLGEMIWQAQRNKSEPDAKAYLACIGKK